MIRKLKLIALGLLLTNSACFSPGVKLDERGDKVTFLKEASEEQLAGFNKLKYIKCELGANGRVPDANNIACKNFLRNEAGRMGSEIMVLEIESDRGSSDYFGEVCNNCVILGGWAYKKKPPQEITASTVILKVPTSGIRLQTKDDDTEAATDKFDAVPPFRLADDFENLKPLPPKPAAAAAVKAAPAKGAPVASSPAASSPVVRAAPSASAPTPSTGPSLPNLPSTSSPVASSNPSPANSAREPASVSNPTTPQQQVPQSNSNQFQPRERPKAKPKNLPGED